MADKIGQINLGLDISQKAFNKQLFGMGKSAENTVTSAFKGVGKKIGVAIGVGAFVAFTKSCLKLGSDLSEVQNVVDTTFTTMNDSVNEFASNAMTQFGLSETVAKKYVGILGTMSKSMGFSEKQAYDMATSVAGLSGDVASFFNITSDEAYTKLKSIWTGETESLKDLGVILTQTNLDQYALNNGFGKTTASMTEQEETMLRYQYTLSSLSAASGDFFKTSDSWANQVRVLGLRFDSLKATLGQGFINLFTPIVKGINNILISLDTLAQKFVSFTELLTGKNAATNAIGGVVNEMSASTDTLTQSVDGLGSTAAKAAEEATSGLAGFDKLNNVAEDSTSSGGSGVPAVSGGGLLNDISASAESSTQKTNSALQLTITKLGELKTALEPVKNFVAQGLSDFYTNTLTPIGQWALGESGLPRFLDITTSILNDINWGSLNGNLSEFFSALSELVIFNFNDLLNFYEFFLRPIALWTMGTGVPGFLDATTQLIDSVDWTLLNEGLSNFYLNLSNLTIFGYDNLLGFYTELLVPVGSWALGTGLPTLVDSLSNGLALIDYETITASFDNLWNSISPFAITIGEGLLWFVENVLVPLGVWAANNLVPGAVDLLSGAFDVLTEIIEALQPLGQWLWDNFLSPIASWTGGVITDVLSSMNDLLTAFSDWCSEHQTTVENIALAVGTFVGVWKLLNAGIVVWNAIGVLATAVTTGFGAAVAFLTSPVTLVIAAIAALVAGIVLLVKNWDKVKEAGAKCWEGIKNAWNAAGEWFDRNFVQPIATSFKYCWDGLKNGAKNAWNAMKSAFSNVGSFFSGIWKTIKSTFTEIGQKVGDAVGSAFKTAINGALTVIENVLNTPIKAINGLLGVINKVPGINLSKLDTFSLPRLAQGGYVEANTPQLAMIGDNRHQGEVVAPEDKLQSLLDKAVANGGTNNLQTLEIMALLRDIKNLLAAIKDKDLIAYITSSELFKSLQKEAKDYTKSTGKQAFS